MDGRAVDPFQRLSYSAVCLVLVVQTWKEIERGREKEREIEQISVFVMSSATLCGSGMTIVINLD